MTKEDEGFENFTKCQLCDNVSAEGDVKVTDHCHITGKYRESANRHCSINDTFIIKIPATFHKNYDSHLIMPELVKYNFKMDQKKCMSFNISNKLISIDSSKFVILNS